VTKQSDDLPPLAQPQLSSARRFARVVNCADAILPPENISNLRLLRQIRCNHPSRALHSELKTMHPLTGIHIVGEIRSPYRRDVRYIHEVRDVLGYEASTRGVKRQNDMLLLRQCLHPTPNEHLKKRHV